MHRYSAVAIDYDGTLTRTARPREDVLEAVARFRAQGGTVVLCTGRILAELRADFAEVERHFDAIVGENGAVLWTPGGGDRALAPPVDAALDGALWGRSIGFRRGAVLLALRGTATEAAAAEIARLGLDAQLVHNRGELMVLPAGVTKGTGVIEALGEMGISRHSTAAVGDAENDHALLDACELGVAVANAVPSLQRRADVVLGEADGDGVIEFLGGAIVRGAVRVHPERWQLELGAAEDGTPVVLPDPGCNVLIAGSTGSGKSHLAGLVIERAVAAGYAVCVLDAEGDHGDLDRLRGVLRVGGPAGVPDGATIDRLLRHRFTSVVIDLSSMPAHAQAGYWQMLEPVLERVRAETGTPHWIVLEEADRLLAGGGLPTPGPELPPAGYVLVTYHPEALAPEVLDEVDCVLALRGAECRARVPMRDASGTLPAQDPETIFTLTEGTALHADRSGARAFRPAARTTRHVRHWHKYVHGSVAPERRFVFREEGRPTERSASNIDELHRELRRATPGMLAHHLHNGDVSRWLEEVIRDDTLAASTREIERWAQGEEHPDPEIVRRALLRAIEARYAEGAAVAEAV